MTESLWLSNVHPKTQVKLTLFIQLCHWQNYIRIMRPTPYAECHMSTIRSYIFKTRQESHLALKPIQQIIFDENLSFIETEPNVLTRSSALLLGFACTSSEADALTFPATECLEILAAATTVGTLTLNPRKELFEKNFAALLSTAELLHLVAPELRVGTTAHVAKEAAIAPNTGIPLSFLRRGRTTPNPSSRALSRSTSLARAHLGRAAVEEVDGLLRWRMSGLKRRRCPAGPCSPAADAMHLDRCACWLFHLFL
ncbi:hypothetical protein Mapa_010104 [Marchantia paleacea]|nr:hypothetical protein Mapa_010104 [Marchantia paleacea]